jgi:Zn-dependent M28 family amino/carboxypeptidase
MNLNFDMIASPNYIRGTFPIIPTTLLGVYDGKSKDSKCFQIQKIFENHYRRNGLEFDLSEFDGRSDYGPFLEKDIPCGGLDSGAEKLKSIEQVQRSGGIAGVAYDQCYHQSCDTIWNVNLMGLKEASQNAANAIETFSKMKNLNSYLNEKSTNEKKRKRQNNFHFFKGNKIFLK